MAPVVNGREKPKVGKDGLTRQQRYYQRHGPKLRQKAREREQKRRAQVQQSKLGAQALVDEDTKGAPITAGIQTAVESTSIGDVRSPAPATTSILKNLPPDFYPTAHKHLDACFAEAMQVLEDDRIIDPIPEGLDELERVARLSKVIMRWASGWGGVAYWPISLDRSFTYAQQEGRQDQWQEQLLNHASMGRRLLAQLYTMGGCLPKEPYKVRELWRIQVGLVEMLVMGITIINTRCSVLPHYWKVKLLPPVPYSDDSAGERSDEHDTIEDDEDEDMY